MQLSYFAWPAPLFWINVICDWSHLSVIHFQISEQIKDPATLTVAQELNFIELSKTSNSPRSTDKNNFSNFALLLSAIALCYIKYQIRSGTLLLSRLTENFDYDNKGNWRYPPARAHNLLELYLTDYCIVAAQIFPVKQKHPKLLEYASISCNDALLADQEAFKHQVQFWVVCIPNYFSLPLSPPCRIYFLRNVLHSAPPAATQLWGEGGTFLKNRCGGRNGRLN